MGLSNGAIVSVHSMAFQDHISYSVTHN